MSTTPVAEPSSVHYPAYPEMLCATRKFRFPEAVDTIGGAAQSCTAGAGSGFLHRCSLTFFLHSRRTNEHCGNAPHSTLKPYAKTFDVEAQPRYNPQEPDFQGVLQARKSVEAVDANVEVPSGQVFGTEGYREQIHSLSGQ